MILVCAYKATTVSNTQTLRNIMQTVGEIPWKVLDLSIKRPPKSTGDQIVAIGDRAARALAPVKITLTLPTFEEIRTSKTTANEDLKKLVESSLPKTPVHVQPTKQTFEAFLCETVEGHSVRISSKNNKKEEIHLTPAEIQYIKTIMDIFGCKKVSAIIKSGD